MFSRLSAHSHRALVFDAIGANDLIKPDSRLHENYSWVAINPAEFFEPIQIPKLEHDPEKIDNKGASFFEEPRRLNDKFVKDALAQFAGAKKVVFILN